ncbi:cobyrinate a,c-diamide synthase [Vagococcus fessus]|uniref:Cobyrinate a,c-diamide synthase n=1 Tax=Vagococcus fessus TaxID=120370 RepID=A0A430ADM3_9ENTE|nr:cobyrinate a,c-diamide synthase [Vagococcus fessus]RSU05293.1 cobyrinic acid a,c-diamide synthase [Vagococcus fessus]
MRKLVIAGTGSGVGKTTVTLGIMSALKQIGYDVQPFKVGPDYIDTAYHTKVTGNKSRNLDSFLIQSDDILNYLFEKEARSSDISIIEGVMGLYDGLGIDKDNCSTASLAKKIKAPVILVIDGKATSTSVAAIVKGFSEFDSDLDIAGVVLNKLASENHYQLVKQSIEKYTDVPVLGYLGKNAMLSLPSRQLGLVPQNEIEGLEKEIELLGEKVRKTIDLDKLLEISVSNNLNSQTLNKETVKKYYSKIETPVKIAYALDDAFNFYYEDNLELMKKKGIELIPFSPMYDQKLPEADAYYIGGGYPEEFAKELAENKIIREELLRKSQKDVPIYAECGGLMYLGSYLKIQDKKYEMVGVFDGFSEMTPSLKRFGYCQGVSTIDTPVIPQNLIVYGHEFHHSIFETSELPIMNMEKWRDGKKIKTWQGGYLKNNTFASYLHLHFFQNSQLIDHFIRKAVECI